ncbi:putative heat shock protein [Leishmania mexicana MHOM/GT/2001/U1103]|uniref:Heat shock protein n=1 Tax=Leishmania mexicana (strain MHOM/GT/2001/U1103) TaxID=929439 RepID=E9AK61_LEIMU|nr:putative heat shock protein [Leishmania mexicana MHOM/GT/2001/U1103]CBZ23311.1 putative heat shock protein [Leishmania mexicana MHOM/GT/2001/U1103]
MLGSLLLAVGNVAAGCLLLGVMAAALFTSLLISCYKIDAPREWPSWGVVLIPVWCFLPVLLLASLTVMTSVRRGMYILLLPSLRLLLCVVIAATTAAALDHRIAPLTAFIPWLIWYVLGTVSDLAMLVPTVYSRTHSPLFGEGGAAGVSGHHRTNTSVEDPFLRPGNGHGEASSIDESEATHSSGAEGGFGNDSPPSQPWKTAQYWREVAEVLFEAVCVYTFLYLAFQRALQQQQAYPGSPHLLPQSGGTTADRIGAAPPLLSFWVILAPLITYFGVHVLVSLFEGSCMDSMVATTPSSQEETPVAGSMSANAATSSQQQQQRTHHRRVSCRERVANVIIRAFPSACGLYMTCMWALKEEYEYNMRTSGPDPSAFLAFLPILVVLGALAFFVCCGGCVMMCIGGALFAAENAATDSATAGVSSASHGSAGSNARENDYRSTVSRTSPTSMSSGSRSHTHARPSQHAGATGAATMPTCRGGNTTDVAIEHID